MTALIVLLAITQARNMRKGGIKLVAGARTGKASPWTSLPNVLKNDHIIVY